MSNFEKEFKAKELEQITINVIKKMSEYSKIHKKTNRKITQKKLRKFLLHCPNIHLVKLIKFS